MDVLPRKGRAFAQNQIQLHFPCTLKHLLKISNAVNWLCEELLKNTKEKLAGERSTCISITINCFCFVSLHTGAGSMRVDTGVGELTVEQNKQRCLFAESDFSLLYIIFL